MNQLAPCTMKLSLRDLQGYRKVAMIEFKPELQSSRHRIWRCHLLFVHNLHALSMGKYRQATHILCPFYSLACVLDLSLGGLFQWLWLVFKTTWSLELLGT